MGFYVGHLWSFACELSHPSFEMTPLISRDRRPLRSGQTWECPSPRLARRLSARRKPNSVRQNFLNSKPGPSEEFNVEIPVVFRVERSFSFADPKSPLLVKASSPEF